VTEAKVQPARDPPSGAVAGAGVGVRLAELVAALSLATDLGLGQPQQHIIRQTLIAMRVAERRHFTDDERAAIFYVSLLAWVGCIRARMALVQRREADRRD